MLRETLVKTILWSIVPIAAAMSVDYGITILLMHNAKGYTPLVTFIIAAVVAFPYTYALVSGSTNLRRARDELAAARDSAFAADRTKTLFFANMSHELRTPLNAILGFSELLSLDAFAGKRVEYARLIHSSGAHLLGLVNDLLDISRIEAGRLELRNATVSIEELIADCAATVEPRVAAAGLRLVSRLEPNLPLMKGDERALKQILLNLLTNAIKFTGARGTVEIFAMLAVSGELAFGVQDDGVGIAKADLGHVFDRFGQGRHDIVTLEKGSGLGLPIVKGLVEAHGGRVALESKVGQGTRVTVWMPRERLAARDAIALAS
jgi:two-component system, cell cycle sensor histidine kinase PleC